MSRPDDRLPPPSTAATRKPSSPRPFLQQRERTSRQSTQSTRIPVTTADLYENNPSDASCVSDTVTVCSRTLSRRIEWSRRRARCARVIGDGQLLLQPQEPKGQYVHKGSFMHKGSVIDKPSWHVVSITSYRTCWGTDCRVYQSSPTPKLTEISSTTATLSPSLPIGPPGTYRRIACTRDREMDNARVTP